jgi:ElaB/YqjD/DUF883 family membrane-anchored ribosome-binding protein
MLMLGVRETQRGLSAERRRDRIPGILEEKMADETTTTPGSAASGDAAEGGRFSRAKDFVSDKYAGASDTVREKYSEIRDKVDEIDFGGLTEQLRSYVRSNPGKALLISIGVGFVVGLLLRRASDDDDE